MSSIVCPLSGSSSVSLIEEINVSDLIKMYGEFFKVDGYKEFGDLKKLGYYHCKESDLRFFYPMVTGSEKLYEQLQKNKWYYMDDKSEYDWANTFIEKTDLVLEIGCGKGAFAHKISAQKYVGLEFSQKAKEIAFSQGIIIENESIQAHSLANPGKYDVVCAFQVLEHVSEIRSFIESSLNALKPGGLLIYSVPSSDSFLSIVTNNILNMPPHHVSFWSDDCLKYVAQIFGIKLVSIEHEKLANIHKLWWASSIILESLRNLLGVQSRLVDMSLNYKILAKISSFAGKVLAKGLVNPTVLPDGHSVTVVYQKLEHV
jgi:2-polyprenyl-3-methyl-5-hydroxy-6-metoxy-1,4-benzoquinol methylase